MKVRPRPIYTWMILFVILASAPAWAKSLETAADPAVAGFSPQRLERIGRVFQKNVDNGVIPGAAVLVARHGQVVYRRAFGMRDPAAKAPLQPDSIFRLYSMTKPVTSLGVLILAEEGKLILNDPVSRFIPQLKNMVVGEEKTDPKTGEPILELVPARREITLHDLLTHTSGLIYEYEFFGKNPVQQAWVKADVWNPGLDLAAVMQRLATVPLRHQPGTRWEYGRSLDVLGRVIEVASGLTLDRFMEERVFKPLNMKDTGFFVKPENLGRVVGAPLDRKTGQPQKLKDVTALPRQLSGGGGLVSTLDDYARFAQMLLNRGELDGVRILSPKMVELMTSDHLGPIPGFPRPGYGFGLGVAVRLAPGLAHDPGSKGDFYWPGLAGTIFWVDPEEDLIALTLINDLETGPTRRFDYLTRDLVYQALME